MGYECYKCRPKVAVDGDTVVVTRKYLDIQFFSRAGSKFEITTRIEIEFIPTVVAINNNTAVIGSWFDKTIHVFERNQNGTWSQAMLLRPDAICPQVLSGCVQVGWFGRAVAIDGNVIIVGAPINADHKGEGYQGSVYVYRRNETTWIKEAMLGPLDNSNAQGFGTSVSIKGNSLVVGDPSDWTELDSGGAAFVYGFDSLSNSWQRVGVTLINYACKEASFLVRLTDNEDVLVVCGVDYSGVSTVYYYEKPGTEDAYALRQRIRFGNDVKSLSVDQNTMIVGEYRVGRSLAIHVFVHENSAWKNVSVVADYTLNAEFGVAVASSGKTTLVASDQNVYPMALL